MNLPRVGMGYDVHKLVEGRPCILGGVKIPHNKGLDGHSDADVLLHAIMDALLGAAGLSDIGQNFPNTDPAYKNISSLQLLREVSLKISKAGFQIGNIDATVVAEEPKIGEHVMKMKELISELLNVQISSVGIKATTNEQMGFVGRGEGIAAFAVALLVQV